MDRLFVPLQRILAATCEKCYKNNGGMRAHVLRACLSDSRKREARMEISKKHTEG